MGSNFLSNSRSCGAYYFINNYSEVKMGILIFAFVVLFFLNKIGDLLRERSIIQRRLGQPVYDWLLSVDARRVK